LDDTKRNLQLLENVLCGARDCIIKLNVSQSSERASARVGADFDVSSCKFPDGDAGEALMLWGAWKDSMHYEQIASATDACMHAAGALTLGVVLRIEEHQGQYEGMEKTLCAAGKAVDREAALHACNPMLLVPVTPLFRAAENLVLAMQARVSVLQHACTVYDGAFHLHEAESQCLDATGAKYVEMQQARGEQGTLESSSKAQQRQTDGAAPGACRG
jgi:hypothetical protein